MYSKSKSALKFLNYYFTASNGKGHAVHSPFVFKFITEILNDRQHDLAYEKVESFRKSLLKNKTVLTIDDYGAGSAVDKTKQRTIASIASHAVKSKKYGQLLFRMVRKYRPDTILELGTSLGITTSYLSLANPEAQVVTLEGASAVSRVAKNNFKEMNLQNVELIEGNFNDQLGRVVAALPSIDFAFIDGNHRKEPTIEYFNSLMQKITYSSVVILDDIHWSAGMEEAWNYCKDHKDVTLSIDLFFLGILFFRKEILQKQHFSIRF